MTEFKLAYPVSFEGVEYKSFNVRRPKVKDTLAVEKIEADEHTRQIRLLAMLCDVSPDVIHELDMKDMAKVLFDQNYDRIWNAKAFQELPPQVQKKLKYQINIDK